MYFVYAIVSEVDQRIYVGFTTDVEKRLKEHNSGKTTSTKGYKPWNILVVEEVTSREEARKREKYLKSGIGKEYLKRHRDTQPAELVLAAKYPEDIKKGCLILQPLFAQIRIYSLILKVSTKLTICNFLGNTIGIVPRKTKGTNNLTVANFSYSNGSGAKDTRSNISLLLSQSFSPP